jgi:hypothetical protein
VGERLQVLVEHAFVPKDMSSLLRSNLEVRHEESMNKGRHEKPSEE